MPIATPQGTLDFKSVDKVTFVGASSNTVIDTTTGSLGVGVGVNGPTSNLHVVGHTRLEGDINMLHTANTASIKLNSNVVTEFTRSKKLIKYPRVAMTGETTSNYTVTGSSWYGSGANYEPWKAFDNVGNHPSGQLAWYSLDHSAPEAYGGTDYAFNPSHGGTATPVLFTGAVQGEWLKIQLPDKIALDHYIIYGPNQESEFPQDWTVYGSVDGTNWDLIDSQVSQIFGNGTGAGGTATGKTKEFYLDTLTNEYLYFGFVFTRGSVNRPNYIGIGEIELYGVPEYDPEAYGTDVTLKSLANVPNTDWLEVYYDGQDYTSMPAAVTDKSGNNRNGSFNGGVGFDSTYKAFTFNGVDQYIKFDSGLTGNAIFSVSMWFISTGPAVETLFQINGDYTGTSGELAWLYKSGNGLFFDFHNNSLQVDYSAFNSNDDWNHVVVTFDGNAATGRCIYANGVKLSGTLGGSSSGTALSLTNNAQAVIGAMHRTIQNDYIHEMVGKIANFRLFNRALTSDEAWQLYAYQKEYFSHGDLSMTLKAGRLGIGTSEPRAALDVKGGAFFNGLLSTGLPAIFGRVNNQNLAQQSTVDQNINDVLYTQGQNMKRTGGGLVFPVAGMYIIHMRTHCWYSGGAYAVKDEHRYTRFNSAGTVYNKQNRGTIDDIAMGGSGGNSDMHHASTVFIHANAGDYVILSHTTSPTTTRNYNNEWNYISAACVCLDDPQFSS